MTRAHTESNDRSIDRSVSFVKRKEKKIDLTSDEEDQRDWTPMSKRLSLLKWSEQTFISNVDGKKTPVLLLNCVERKENGENHSPEDIEKQTKLLEEIDSMFHVANEWMKLLSTDGKHMPIDKYQADTRTSRC